MKRLAILLAISASLGILAGALWPSTPVQAVPERVAAVKQHVQEPRTIQPKAHVVVTAVLITVQPGDTLSKIAAAKLGDPKAWPAIWWHNRSKVANPNVLLVGQRLVIPVNKSVPEWLSKRANAAAGYTAPTNSTSPPVSNAAPAPAATGGFGSPPASFTACVISRESGGDPTAYNSSSGASGLFGMEPAFWASISGGYYAGQYPGGAYTAPSSVQYQAFYAAYAQDGTAPWAPYDGC